MKDDHLNVFCSEEDGGYIADLPGLRYCSALGEMPFEALQEVEKAEEAWLASARNLRKPIPKPAPLPVICQLANDWILARTYS